MRPHRPTRLFVAISLSLFACGEPVPVALEEDAPPEETDEPGVAVRSLVALDSLLVGDRFVIRALGSNNGLLDPTRLTWTSDAPEVASVSGTGEVEALGRGAATIYVSGGINTASAVVVVQEPPVSAHLEPGDTAVYVGERFQFRFAFRDEDGVGVSGLPTWTLSDSTVASVTWHGYFAALAPGELDVIVSRDSLADTARVVVRPVGVAASVRVVPDTQSLAVGVPMDFGTAAYDSAGARIHRGAVWAVSDTTIAVVTSNGRVTGLRPGRVTVTATLDGITGMAAVTVGGETLTFASVAAGGEHSCGLTPEGVAYCWGRSHRGQLGREVPLQCESDYSPAVVECSPRPVRVRTDVRFASLAGGIFHTCGIDLDGRAWCWGDDTYGQLGTGSLRDYSWEPLPVATSERFVQLAGSGRATCGITTGGALYCWGTVFVSMGGDLPSGPVPVHVAVDHDFRSVAVSSIHLCAIDTAGVMWCWGKGVALGSQPGSQCADGSPCSGTPLRVPVEHSWGAVAVGIGFSCGLDDQGQAWCWGANDRGQLADRSDQDRVAPDTVATSGRFVDIAAGAWFTCARSAQGTALCWGVNNGTFGNGSDLLGRTDYDREPVQGVIGLTPVVISGGFEHACAVAVDGRGYCWGRNWQGQVGDGTHGLSNRVLSPSEVIGVK